jgi:hypothetical protein
MSWPNHPGFRYEVKCTDGSFAVLDSPFALPASDPSVLESAIQSRLSQHQKNVRITEIRVLRAENTFGTEEMTVSRHAEYLFLAPSGRAHLSPAHVRRCHLALGFACLLLPCEIRQTAIEELTDEISSAAEAKRRLMRRTLSIAVRTVPRLAWEARRPMRVRGGSG